MIQIFWDLTAVKKMNEITSEQIFGWARRVAAQRAQKAVIEAKKHSKEFDAMKKHEPTEEKLS